jgi:ribose/xylose/arabinose/galactoside ABC-type transport system permease subunit
MAPGKPDVVRISDPKRFGFWMRVFVSEHFVLLLSVGYFLLLWPLTPGLVSADNIRNIFSNMLPLLLVALGQTFVLITGGIDLSVTSIIAIASVAGGSVMSADRGLLASSRWAAPAGVITMLAIGLLCGGLNGAAVTRFHMPPFMVTLASMMFLSGFSIWFTRSRNIRNLPREFNQIGKGSILSVPIGLLVAVAVCLVAHFLLSRTLFGHWLYAVGRNWKASVVSGVPVWQTVVAAYSLSGICAAAASILYTGRLETASPVLGQRIFLDVIAAAVIGGSSLFGGKGKVSWTVSGTLFITLIDNTLNLQGLSNFMILLVKGVVILIAALLDMLRNRMLVRAWPT